METGLLQAHKDWPGVVAVKWIETHLGDNLDREEFSTSASIGVLAWRWLWPS